MNLSPPTTIVFIVSVILALLAVIGKFAAIPFITEHGFWVAILAYVVLAAICSEASSLRAGSGGSERHPDACRALLPEFPLSLNQLVRAPNRFTLGRGTPAARRGRSKQSPHPESG